MGLETPAVTRLALVLLAGALVGGCVVQPVTVPATASPPVANPAAAIEQFIALANEARAEAGCRRPLVVHAGVTAVAQAHSEDMRRRDYFAHDTPEGLTPMGRVQAAGIEVWAVAENIALGQPTGRAAFESWRNSPGHARNMLNCDYSHHGVGLAGAHWTHLLVVPR